MSKQLRIVDGKDIEIMSGDTEQCGMKLSDDFAKSQGYEKVISDKGEIGYIKEQNELQQEING